MTSHHHNSHSKQEKMEQIIDEFFAKSLHIILESRCPCACTHTYSPSDMWDNLALQDCPAALKNISFRHQGNHELMVADVILVERPGDLDYLKCSPRRGFVRNLSSKLRLPCCWSTENDEYGREMKSGRIIERWIVQYDSGTGSSGGSGNKRLACTSSHTLYKKSVLLLRSLDVTARLLPAYKLFRQLNSSGQIWTRNLVHRVSFVEPEPFTCQQGEDIQWFLFSPVDTSNGRLCVSVSYHSSASASASLADVRMEPLTGMLM